MSVCVNVSTTATAEVRVNVGVKVRVHFRVVVSRVHYYVQMLPSIFLLEEKLTSRVRTL